MLDAAGYFLIALGALALFGRPAYEPADASFCRGMGGIALLIVGVMVLAR